MRNKTQMFWFWHSVPVNRSGSVEWLQLQVGVCPQAKQSKRASRTNWASPRTRCPPFCRTSCGSPNNWLWRRRCSRARRPFQSAPLVIGWGVSQVWPQLDEMSTSTSHEYVTGLLVRIRPNVRIWVPAPELRRALRSAPQRRPAAHAPETWRPSRRSRVRVH